MSDRTINFGESETEATYQIQDTDSTGGGNFVVAKDTNANTVLLQYDPATDTWQYAGDVDMNGGNVSGVGTLTAESVNTGELGTENSATVVSLSEDQTIPHDTETLVEFDDTKLNQIGFDTENHKFVSEHQQTVSISFKAQARDDLDALRVSLNINGSTEMRWSDFSGVPAFTSVPSHTEEFELDEGDEISLFIRGETSDETAFDLQATAQRTTLLRIRRV